MLPRKPKTGTSEPARNARFIGTTFFDPGELALNSGTSPGARHDGRSVASLHAAATKAISGQAAKGAKKK
jgi:hypothetical protein